MTFFWSNTPTGRIALAFYRQRRSRYWGLFLLLRGSETHLPRRCRWKETQYVLRCTTSGMVTSLIRITNKNVARWNLHLPVLLVLLITFVSCRPNQIKYDIRVPGLPGVDYHSSKILRRSRPWYFPLPLLGRSTLDESLIIKFRSVLMFGCLGHFSFFLPITGVSVW